LKSNDKKYADAEALRAIFWADEDKDEFILVLSLLMYNVVLALGGGSRGGGAPWQIIAPHLPFHLITAYCMRNAVNVCSPVHSIFSRDRLRYNFISI